MYTKTRQEIHRPCRNVRYNIKRLIRKFHVVDGNEKKVLFTCSAVVLLFKQTLFSPVLIAIVIVYTLPVEVSFRHHGCF